MEKYKNIKSEHQLRSLVFDDYFKNKEVSWELEIEKIDFIITEKKARKEKEGGSEKHYFWAETKKSVTEDYDMLTQLLLTIKKPYDKNEYTIPNYVGCFDTEKIIFVPTKLLLGIFKDSDVKWNIPPNDTKNEYFKKLKRKLIYELGQNKKEVKNFIFGTNGEEIKDFIKNNIIKGNVDNKFEITDNNFDRVYLNWLEKVKPSLAVNWEEEKKNGLYDAHFYLADLLSIEDIAIINKLLIVLQSDYYRLTKVMKKSNALIAEDKYYFKDKQKAYFEFWSKYKRPPLPQFWDNILLRQDLLVPQDIRERKGSFFTPQIWVELSQKYIADVFGDNWQDEYYVWDCCAGTGNLLVGINRKIENVFASTIDEADVKVMYDRIENGAKLLKKNVFQFDFLNDDFKKLPKTLRDIIDDPEKRKKLIIYINPPYAEAATTKQRIGTGKNKLGVSGNTIKYTYDLGKAGNELFAQFFWVIYNNIKNCKLATFGTLKYIKSSNFIQFREYFKVKYCDGFICPSNTFDNVNGRFPISFLIWDLSIHKKIQNIKTCIFDDNGNYLGIKKHYSQNKGEYLSNWLSSKYDKINEPIGYLKLMGTDIQNNGGVCIYSKPYENDIKKHMVANITKYNLIDICIYLSIRQCIEQTWLNNRDQFLYPNNNWENDIEFKNDCFIFSLFHGQNKISSKYGINHWIPFTEEELGITSKLESHIMSDFIAGKIEVNKDNNLFENNNNKSGNLKFSKDAKNVYNAGLELWKYYHTQSRVNINASFYDIRLYFQGEKNGRMNNKSNDDEYNNLINDLRDKMKILAKKIEPKVYEYGFLLK